jgi:hypothetical protein
LNPESAASRVHTLELQGILLPHTCSPPGYNNLRKDLGFMFSDLVAAKKYKENSTRVYL